MKAILVEVDCFPVSKLRWRAVAGLMMACGANGWSAAVVNANESPPNRRLEIGDETAVVTPDRCARLQGSVSTKVESGCTYGLDLQKISTAEGDTIDSINQETLEHVC